MSRSYQADERS